MANVRKMKVLPDDEAVLYSLPYTEEQIQDVEDAVAGALEQMGEDDNFSHMTFARGALRVLKRQFGAQFVRRACEAETIL